MAKRVKNILGIKDFSLFRKEMHKKIGKIIYHQKYNADDLIKVMCSMGMKEGSIICIHSSMKEFYNFQGTAVEIIDKVLQVIGPDGTLVMPFRRKNNQNRITIFLTLQQIQLEQVIWQKFSENIQEY